MSGRNRATAYLGLGGNLGDARASIVAALRILESSPDIEVKRVSSLYRTPPWGMTDQPDFLNAVAEVATRLPPRRLLDACLDAEKRLKRVRGERWGPRVIDLDVLVFANRHIEEDGLSIPHPRIAERAFVLVPLLEIAPDIEIDGRRLAGALAAVDSAGITRIDTDPDWWRAA